MENSSAGDDFEFARHDARALRAPHQVADGAGVFGADQLLERAGVLGGGPEDFGYSWINTDDVAFGVERQRASGNVFENGFDELAAALKFAHSFLKIVRETVDLRAGVAKLSGHAVEGTDQVAQFVMRLFRDLIIKIAGRYFSGAFGESLNGHGDLLG